MSRKSWQVRSRTLGLGLLGVAACVSPTSRLARFDFSQPLAVQSVWRPRIALWQGEARLEAVLDAPRPSTTPLAAGYADFTRELRLETVRRVVRWVQLNSGLYFAADGELEHWPTLDEVLARGGDDCDGMELLTFELLRRMGFGPGELYRAVLVETQSDRHHMVTLWFPEGRGREPYVLDPNGEVSREVLPLSAIDRWEPVLIFDEAEQYAAERRLD